MTTVSPSAGTGSAAKKAKTEVPHTLLPHGANETPNQRERRHEVEAEIRRARDEHLRELRANHPELTLSQLAEWAGLSKAGVSKILAHKVSWEGQGPGRPARLDAAGRAIFAARLKAIHAAGIPLTKDIIREFGTMCYLEAHPDATHVPHFDRAYLREIDEVDNLDLVKLVDNPPTLADAARLRLELGQKMRDFVNDEIAAGDIAKEDVVKALVEPAPLADGLYLVKDGRLIAAVSDADVRQAVTTSPASGSLLDALAATAKARAGGNGGSSSNGEKR